MFPSIYDVAMTGLAGADLTRPLFVQACRAHQFDAILDVIHHRLGLPPERSTLLTTATYPARPWDRYTRFVRADERLTEHTVDAFPEVDWLGFSALILCTTAGFSDPYGTMRFQSNLACFCHAMEPVPSLLINNEGQITTARRLFQIVDRTVDGTVMTGNIQVSEAETRALYDAAMARADGEVCEVGRFSGGTAMVLALAGRTSKRPGLTSIDIECLPAAEYFFRLNRLDEDITLWHGDSIAMAAKWGAGKSNPDVGLLFIDADHGYDAVSRDLAAWAPFVVRGGTVVLHDVGSPDCGVARAVYYHLAHRPGFTNFRQVDSMLFCERAAGTR